MTQFLASNGVVYSCVNITLLNLLWLRLEKSQFLLDSKPSILYLFRYAAAQLRKIANRLSRATIIIIETMTARLPAAGGFFMENRIMSALQFVASARSGKTRKLPQVITAIELRREMKWSQPFIDELVERGVLPSPIAPSRKKKFWFLHEVLAAFEASRTVFH